MSVQVSQLQMCSLQHPRNHTLVELLGIWSQRRRDRQHLAQLDDRLLRDLGVDRVEAMHEAAKPFWQV